MFAGLRPEFARLAIVTVDRDLEAAIHRGLPREAEAKALRALERLRPDKTTRGKLGEWR